MAPFILNLSTRWRQVVNFYTQATLPPEKMLRGPQRQSGHLGDKKYISFSCWELNPDRPAHSLVAMPTEFLGSHKHWHSL